MAFISFSAESRPAVFVIDASSNNASQIGATIGTEVQKAFPDLQRQYDSYLASIFSASQLKQLAPQVTALKTEIDANYKAEVEAIAANWQLQTVGSLGDGKLSVDEFWLLQLLADLTAIDKGSIFAVDNDTTRNPIAARNLDWRNTPDLRALQAITVYHYQNRTVVLIGFAGLVNVISGFNDRGLFVSLLDAGVERVITSALPQNSVSFDLRAVLKNEDKFASASRELAEKIYIRDHQVLFADRDGVAVMEQAAGEIGHLRRSDSEIVNEMPWNNQSTLAAVGCFVLKVSPRNCYSTGDVFRWGALSRLSGTLKDTESLTVDQVIDIMQDRTNVHQAVFNKDTLQTLVFTPKDRALYLYTQPVLAVDERHPLLEKYQFVNTSTTVTEQWIEYVLLILGTGVLVFAWFYVFRGRKKSEDQP